MAAQLVLKAAIGTKTVLRDVAEFYAAEVVATELRADVISDIVRRQIGFGRSELRALSRPLAKEKRRGCKIMK